MTQPAGPEVRVSPTVRRRSARHRLQPSVLAVIAVGGALGAGLRHELLAAVPHTPGEVPWTTLGINLGGSFALGVLLTFVLERWPPTRYVRPFLAIGFLGAFTTFSTFTVDLDVLLEDGHVGVAVLDALISLVGGLVAAFAGIVAGRAWPSPRRSVQ